MISTRFPQNERHVGHLDSLGSLRPLYTLNDLALYSIVLLWFLFIFFYLLGNCNLFLVEVTHLASMQSEI